MQNYEETESTQAFISFNLLPHPAPELLALMLFVPTYFAQEACSFVHTSRCRAYNLFSAPNGALSSTSPSRILSNDPSVQKMHAPMIIGKNDVFGCHIVEIIKLITKLYMFLAFFFHVITLSKITTSLRYHAFASAFIYLFIFILFFSLDSLWMSLSRVFL